MLKRNIKVMFRVNEEEFEQLQNRAKRCGYAREHYIRTVLSGHVPKESPPIEFWKMINELNAIGNNLNQIAARANATGFFLAEEYMANAKKLFDILIGITDAVCLPERIDSIITANERSQKE